MNGKELSPVNLPYLPDELLLNCLARVSRLYYPTLALISKRFRSLIASTELYETQTLLGRTESCLYVHLGLPLRPVRWLTLYRRPTRILNPNPNPSHNPNLFSRCFRPYRKKEKKSSSDNIMVSIRTHNFSAPSCNLVALGSNIYKIGGFINGALSSRVFFMDCRSHTWHEAPSMRITRMFPQMSVLDGKIYVVEGFQYFESSNSIECFDPKTQSWEDVPSPGAEISFLYKTLAIEGKLYLFGNVSVVYKPKENRWDRVELERDMCLGLGFQNFCVIDNVLYRCYKSSKTLEWYDFKVRSWRSVKGLGRLPKLPWNRVCVRLVDHGGKIAVLWEENVCGIGLKEKKIWCAEIVLYKGDGNEIYGKVEWCDVVLTVPKLYAFLQFIAATV